MHPSNRIDNTELDRLIRSDAPLLEIAAAYLGLGFAVIPVPFRKKKPALSGWQNFRLSTDDLASHFKDGTPSNIGVLLGAASGGLVDIDLDCPEAIRLAPNFLPKTGWVFGRAGSRQAHLVYRVSGQAPRVEGIKDVDGAMMLEARGNGHHTVFPGSVHVTGERIEFERTGELGIVPWVELQAAFRRLAAATLLARHWPKEGSRHDAALALAGTLLRAGWNDDWAQRFISSVAAAANDGEVPDRVRAVASTRARLERGETVRGLPSLADMIGETVAPRLASLLGLRDRAAATTPQANYRTDERGTWWIKPTKDGPIDEFLANFRADIVTDITETDGAEERRSFEVCVEGVGEPRVLTLRAEDFMRMNWMVPVLGARAVVAPGLGKAEHLRCAIQTLSVNVESRRIFGHTGWTRIGEKDVFLHAGGAIGADGPLGEVETRLEGSLAGYRLPPPPDGEELRLVIDQTLGLIDLGPRRVILPLLASTARSVLSQCDFSVFMHGPTGTFKSELASIIQRFFGPGFDARHLPGSWSSTANALEEQAFLAKDVVLVVDDFKPSGDRHSDAKLHQLADRVLRAAGNGGARARMRSDTTLRSARPPRSLILATGEELPLGESLRARLVNISIEPGTIKAEELGKAQNLAAGGVYAQFMSAFIRWCAARLPALRGELAQRLPDLRSTYQGAHARTAGAFAELEIALDLLLRFCCEASKQEVLTHREAELFVSELRSALVEMVKSQHAEIAEADPVHRFLELLSSALASGRAHIASRDGSEPPNSAAWGWRVENGTPRAMGTRVGWVDTDSLYLDSDACYSVVSSMAPPGQGVNIALATLHRRMADRKLLLSTETSRNTFKVRIVIEGRRRNVLHLPINALDITHPQTPGDAARRKAVQPLAGSTDHSDQPDQSEGSPDLGRDG